MNQTHLAPDRFFTAEQQRRLAEAMRRWREARDHGRCLPDDQQKELDELVESELRATAERARHILERRQQGSAPHEP